MSLRGGLVVLALCSCALDERHVEVDGPCTRPASDGLVVDFSEASQRSCPAGFCTHDLVGYDAVSLGEDAPAGLIFPYAPSDIDPVDLGTVDSDAGRAVWAAVSTAPPAPDATPAPDGFALQFVRCVDTSGYSALSFSIDTTGGDLGGCSLRSAAQLLESDGVGYGVPLPLDEYPGGSAAPVQAGINTLPLSPAGAASTHSLLGLQWEFTVETAHPAGCNAYFTLDDIRLVKSP
jgi:hypothetical protein